MAVHLNSGDGGAKCGVNVYYKNYLSGNKVDPASRTIMRRFVHFEDPEKGIVCNCKRCLNKIARPQVIVSNEDLTGKVFHYSFGYDMTINVFAKVIKKTSKGYLCQEVKACWSGEPYAPGGDGRAKASNEFIEDSKPFLMVKKVSSHYSKYEYWTGKGNHWNLVNENESFYENHWD